MPNFLGPFYDFIHVDRAESLYGASLMTSYPIGNLDMSLPLRSAASNQALAFEFVATKGGTLKYVDLWLQMVGNIGTGAIQVTPYSNSAGLPAAALGSASQPVQVTDIPSGQWTRTRFTFAAPITLVALTTYHIVVTGTFAISGSAYIAVAGDSVPSVAARSDVFNGSAWSPATYLVLHEVFIEEQGAVSQTFRASGGQQVDTVVLYLKKTGSPGGNLFVELQEDLNGQPSGSGPADNMSDPIAASTLTTGYTPVAFTFTPMPTLVDGRKYHIILRSTGTLSSANNVDIGVDGSSPNYSGNQFNRTNNDGSWYAYPSIDAAFLVYYNQQPLPSTLADELMLLGNPPLDCQDLAEWLRNFRDTLTTFYPAVIPTQYGGTGMANFQKGDMLYASAPGHLEVLPAGPDGTTLSMAQGVPSWGGSGSNLVQSLYNNSGVTLYPYDAVVFDPALPQAVKTSLPKAGVFQNAFAGIVQEPIAPGAWGAVLTHGLGRTRLSGSVSAGDILMPFAGTRMGKPGGVPVGGVVALEAGVDSQIVQVFVNAVPGYLEHRRRGSWSGSSPTTVQLDSWSWTLPTIAGFLVELDLYFNSNTNSTASLIQHRFLIDGVVAVSIVAQTNQNISGQNQRLIRFSGDVLPGAHTFSVDVIPNGYYTVTAAVWRIVEINWPG